MLATKRREQDDDLPFDWDVVPASIALPLPAGIAEDLSEVAVGPYSLKLPLAFFIDIKTSISSRIKADYLYQLAGYFLLDYDNRLDLNALGIYMARQGHLVA